MSEIPEIKEGENVLHLSLGEDQVEAGNEVVEAAAKNLQETQKHVDVVISAPKEEVNALVLNQLNMAIESFKRGCDYPVSRQEGKPDLNKSLEDWKQTAKKAADDIYAWIKNLLVKMAEFLNNHFDEVRRLKGSAASMVEAAKSRQHMTAKDGKIVVEGVLEALYHQGEKSYPGSTQINKFYGLHCGYISAWMENSFHQARFNLIESVLEDLLTSEHAGISDEELWKKIVPIFSALPQVKIRSLNQKNLAPGMTRYEQPLFYDASSIYLEIPTVQDSGAAPLLKYLKFGMMQDSAYSGRVKTQKSTDPEDKNSAPTIPVLPIDEIQRVCTQMQAYLDEYKTTKASLGNLEKLADRVRSTKYSEHNTFGRQGYILLILNRIVGGYVSLEKHLRAYDARVAKAVLKWCEKSLHQYV
jgi:hypothetical protein